MGVGLWVIGTEKGEGGYCGTKRCLLCLANAQQIKSGRNKKLAALQASECGVFACTRIESVRLPSCWLCLANAQQIGAD